MTLIIETGAVVAGANTFVSTDELSDYLNARGYVISGNAEPLLVRSFDLLMILPWCDLSVVTAQMKKAQCEVAYQMDKGFDPSQTVEREVKREKVDVIEVEYGDTSGGESINPLSAIRKIPTAYGFIKDLLCTDSPAYLLRA